MENLTGDVSLDWVGRSLPSIATAQLIGVRNVVPLRAEAVRDAYNLKATRFVHGYFDRRGGSLRFSFYEEDAATHKMADALTVSGDVLAAARRLATQIDPQAHAFSSANLEAIAAWGRLDFERATALDPEFSAAWRDWVQSRAAAGNREEALAVADRALARAEWRSPVDRAQVALIAASLRGDSEARKQALMDVVRLVPNDVVSVRALAEQEMNARRYSESVALFREALRIDSSDPFVRNLLGYALFHAGDLPAARREFDEYAKAPGHEANAADSQGEVLFMAGQFADAERYFLQAHEKGPELLDGVDLSKAAYARWLRGDLKGADEIFEKFLRYRADHGDQATVWRQAVWEYSTGRQTEARTRLMSAQGPAAEIAQRQLQVWNQPGSLPKDTAALERAYQQTQPAADGLVRTLYAMALLRDGRAEEARRLVQPWPLPESGEPLMQGFLYPMYLELRRVAEKGGQK